MHCGGEAAELADVGVLAFSIQLCPAPAALLSILAGARAAGTHWQAQAQAQRSGKFVVSESDVNVRAVGIKPCSALGPALAVQPRCGLSEGGGAGGAE